jgi:hypothetical protein
MAITTLIRVLRSRALGSNWAEAATHRFSSSARRMKRSMPVGTLTMANSVSSSMGSRRVCQRKGTSKRE